MAMAKFNEKVLCLFHKEYKQLKKEAARRGMVHNTREETIAKIIWKDAYDAGLADGKSGNVEPEVREYLFHDNCNDVKYRLELTKEQVSAIKWMSDHAFLIDVEISEWCDSFEDVGRI